MNKWGFMPWSLFRRLSVVNLVNLPQVHPLMHSNQKIDRRLAVFMVLAKKFQTYMEEQRTMNSKGNSEEE